MWWIIPVFALSIPLVAIIGGYYVALKKMEIKNQGLKEEDKRLISKLMQDNIDLKQRVENLEEIVTSFDKDALSLNTAIKNAEIQGQLNKLTSKLKKR